MNSTAKDTIITSTDPRAALARRTPFFYGWAIVLAAGSTKFDRKAAAT